MFKAHQLYLLLPLYCNVYSAIFSVFISLFVFYFFDSEKVKVSISLTWLSGRMLPPQPSSLWTCLDPILISTPAFLLIIHFLVSCICLRVCVTCSFLKSSWAGSKSPGGPLHEKVLRRHVVTLHRVV